jgi:hypothetical protein
VLVDIEPVVFIGPPEVPELLSIPPEVPVDELAPDVFAGTPDDAPASPPPAGESSQPARPRLATATPTTMSFLMNMYRSLREPLRVSASNIPESSV